MLTLKIEENKQELAEEMGLEFKDRDIVIAARESGALLGVGVMHLHYDFVVIEDIRMKEPDFSLEYGMGKALLNVADLRGARHAVTDNKDIEDKLKALKFKTVEEAGDEVPDYIADFVYYLNLEGYFSANC